jgi:ribosomal protein S18 acetylase RimI-like enzyme
MAFVIVPFANGHLKENFDCGEAAHNLYLDRQSRQDIRRHYAAMFVAVQKLTNRILGFYTLSSASVKLALLPEPLRKKLPKCPDVPAVRLGRLAVDKSMQKQGIGEGLLADAVIRSLRSVPSWAVLVVDAKDEKASVFYRKFGFMELLDDRKHLYSFRQNLEKRILEAKEK